MDVVKMWVVAGGLLVVLLGLQAVAGTTIGPVTKLTTKDENRQILISEEGSGYDPNEPTVVYTGPGRNIQAYQVPMWQAIELELDQLERHGISLLKLALTTQSTAEPDWPLVGHIKFRERAWMSLNPQCPSVDPNVPAPIMDQYDHLVDGQDDDDRLGILTTDVSFDYQEEGGDETFSNIYYWPLGSNLNDEPTASWQYVAWELQGGPVIDDYFCRAQVGQLLHKSIITGYLDRIDDGPV